MRKYTKIMPDHLKKYEGYKMANKRMFTMKIVDSDAFLDMPLSTQCLYFHLNMRADDDGFVGNTKRIMRTIGASEDDLKILLAKRFLLSFDDGIVVIKHWWMHNTLMKDRYHETVYVDEKKSLGIKQNKAYTLSDNRPLTECYQIDNSDLDLDLDKDLDLDINITLSKDNVCSTDVQRAVEEWNNLSDIGIKPISKLSSGTKRYESLKARIKQYGINEVIRAINKIHDSDFLQGKSKDWIITFDWFVKPNNFPKVLDGNYDNNQTDQGQKDNKWNLPDNLLG